MKREKITWMVGSVLCASLVIAAPANAARNGNAGIAAAKRYHVTQISERDVVVARSPRAGAVENARRVPYLDPDVQRLVLLPNPDAKPDMQLMVVRPNEEMQRVVLLPNPDAKPDMQLMVVRPNEEMQRVILLPNPEAKPDTQ